MEDRGRIPELDAVRGIAILMVVFYHGFNPRFGTAGLTLLPKIFVSVVHIGWMGVNLFFALSGFLITGILLDTKKSSDYYRRFYIARCFRILPAYYGALLLLLIVGKFILPERTISLPFIGLCFLYLANLTPLLGVPLQFEVLWSLAVEEHFYLLWPTLVRKLSPRSVGICAILIVLASTFARIVTFKLRYNYFAHYTWLVADGLAMGALLSVLIRGPLGTISGVRRVAFSFFAIAVTLVFIDKVVHRALFGGALDLTALNIACSGIVAFVLSSRNSIYGFILRAPLLIFFGNISYGLYLIHMFVFNAFDASLAFWFPQIPSPKGHFEVLVVRFLISFIFATALAALSRRYFEGPFLDIKRRLTQRSLSLVEKQELDKAPVVS